MKLSIAEGVALLPPPPTPTPAPHPNPGPKRARPVSL